MENYLKLQEKQNMETVLRLNKRCKKMDWAFFKKDLQLVDGRMKTRNKQEENHGI